MKKLIGLFVIVFCASFSTNGDIMMTPQSTNILYADVIFLGKVSKIEDKGFYVEVAESIINNTKDKNLLKKKEIYVTHDMKPENPGRYQFFDKPDTTTQYIFTLKYNEKSKTIHPLFYSFGLPVEKNQKNSCTIIGYEKYEHHKKPEVIQAIKLLHKCYPKLDKQWGGEKIVSKVSTQELLKVKKSNKAVSIWIEDIEKRARH